MDINQFKAMDLTAKLKFVRRFIEEEGLAQLFQSEEFDIHARYSDTSIYHYTSIFSLKSILEHKKIWVTRSDFLNDPTELSYIRDVISDVCDDLMNGAPDSELPVFKQMMMESVPLSLSTDIDIYILSLTTNKDSLALWGNYSQYEGYCMGFNLVETLKHCAQTLPDHGFRFIPGKVIYDKNVQKKFLRPEIERIFSIWKRDPTHKLPERALVAPHIFSLFFKHPSFAQEEEFRIAIYAEDHIDAAFRIANGAFIPYIDVPFEVKSGKYQGQLPLSSITIGPKNNIDIAETGLHSFLDSLGYQDTVIYRSEIPLRF